MKVKILIMMELLTLMNLFKLFIKYILKLILILLLRYLNSLTKMEMEKLILANSKLNLNTTYSDEEIFFNNLMFCILILNNIY